MTHNIRHQIAAIKQEEIHRVFENLKRRINLCISELGGHFQQFRFLGGHDLTHLSLYVHVNLHVQHLMIQYLHICLFCFK